MKILNASQIRLWDEYTIKNEGITSVELMEKAASVFSVWYDKLCTSKDDLIIVFCGTGNNGGDGLAVARLLHNKFYNISYCIIGDISNAKQDFIVNYERIKKIPEIKQLSFSELIDKSYNPIIIDAIFGTGINKVPSGEHETAIKWINNKKKLCYSIDCPSGLFIDYSSPSLTINSDFTGTFGCPKLAFLIPENQTKVGRWEVLDIGLSEKFYAEIECKYHLTTIQEAFNCLKPRPKFSHKGSFGHGLLIAGSKNMPGAAMLSSKAAMKSGIGKLTLYSHKSVLTNAVQYCPEIILSQQNFPIDKSIYSFIGIGPGLGKNIKTEQILLTLLEEGNPLLIDADALNLIAKNQWVNKIPSKSIITPHRKEFERLFGKVENSFDMLRLQMELSTKLDIYIVSKGHRSAISTPEGFVYFNSSGNTGLASAGSGDVLFGIILSLIAQGYSTHKALILSVFWHGLTAEVYSKNEAEETMNASDIIILLGKALRRIKSIK